MAIKFNGEFEVKRPPKEVYDFLTDPKKFGPLLPDFQGMTAQDATHFTVKVNVGISYIKGVAEVKLELVPGATHLFQEPGTLEQVAKLASEWFRRHLSASKRTA